MKLRIVGSVEWVMLVQFGEAVGGMVRKVMTIGRVERNLCIQD